MFRKAIKIRIDAIKDLYWQIRQEKEFRCEVKRAKRHRVKQMREIEKSMFKVAKEEEKEFRSFQKQRLKHEGELARVKIDGKNERQLINEEIIRRVRERY